MSTSSGPRFLILTILGPDRPGLVETLSQTIADHGGNWLESRMSRLGGQFAGILRVQVSGESEAGLTGALRSLIQDGIEIHFQSEPGAEHSHDVSKASITVTGPDRPGIVREVTSVLRSLGVNVEELLTETRPAPMSNEPLFQAHATLGLPNGVSEDDVRDALENLDDTLIVDLGGDRA